MSDDAKGSARPRGDDPDNKITWSNFWKRPEIVVSVVIGLLGLGGAAWGVAAASQPPPDPVAECRERHPTADGKPVRTDGQIYRIEGCGQPGTPGVTTDGLWRAEVTFYTIPNTAMVDEYTHVEVFSTGCPALGLDYFFSNMGAAVHNRFVFQTGQIVSGNDGKPENISGHGIPTDVQQLSRGDDRLVVLNNGRNELHAVSCEPLSALAASQGGGR
ncbi:hypothetical protein WMO79_01780 [Micrococcaceae bacterium Sec7.4]